MVKTARTLQDYIRFRVGLEAICDSCDGRWDVDLRQAVRVLGGTARQEDLNGRAKCPYCDNGHARASDPVFDKPKSQRPTFFPGAWEEVHSDEEP